MLGAGSTRWHHLLGRFITSEEVEFAIGAVLGAVRDIVRSSDT